MSFKISGINMLTCNIANAGLTIPCTKQAMADILIKPCYDKKLKLRYFIPGTLLIILICLFVSVSIPVTALTQTKDTTENIFQSQPADTATASLTPVKKQLSEIVKSLIEQKKLFEVSFNKTLRYKIEKDAKMLQFPFGTSPAVLFKLPHYEAEYILKIKSLVHGIGYTFHIFSPSGVFLDSSFWPTHLLSEKNFLLSNPGPFDILSLKTEIPINEFRKSDKYLLIYTFSDSTRVGSYTNNRSGLLIGFFKHPVEKSPFGKLELELHRK